MLARIVGDHANEGSFQRHRLVACDRKENAGNQEGIHSQTQPIAQLLKVRRRGRVFPCKVACFPMGRAVDRL